MKRKHPIQSARPSRNCAPLTPATTGMNARVINCDLVNARPGGSADQRRLQRHLFLLWHQKWLQHLRQEGESETSDKAGSVIS